MATESLKIEMVRVTLTDVPVLSALAKKTFYDTFVDTCTREDMEGYLEQYYSEAQLAMEVSDGEDFCYFGRVDGVPTGYIRFMEDSNSLEEMKKWKSLELKRLYILKEYQGKGVAQALMDFFLEHAKRNGYEAVFLGVWEFNYRAQKFYKKYGFTDSGHSHYFPIGNTPQTDLWYWRFLKQ